MGPEASSILGNLSANGRVFLINPNGILFGSSTMNEAEIQNQIRLQASELGWRLWLNVRGQVRGEVTVWLRV